MRRRRLALSVLLSFAMLPLLFAVASVADIGYLGWACLERPPHKAGFGSEVVGIGSRSQTNVHYRLFINRFSGTCRPDRQGLVRFTADGDEVVVRAMLLRQSDRLLRRYVLYGLDRALTAAEKQQIEQDTAGRGQSRISLVVQIPLWIDGLAVSYNVGCPAPEVKLTSTALSKIFSGLVSRWNDPLITADNPALATCDQSIRVAVRADPSEATTVFKDYLSKRNPQWRSYREGQLAHRWPPTLLDPCRGRGDAGMVGCIAGQPGSIGYVSFREAFRHGLATAAVGNRTGFVAPGYRACTRAAEVPAYPPRADLDWSQVSLTDPAVGYPICRLEFALAFEKMSPAYAGLVSIAQVRTVRDYLVTSLAEETQRRLPRYGVAPLSETLLGIARDGVASIGYLE